jgi:hypothetical protein
MISRCTNSIPLADVVFPRLADSASTNFKPCSQRCQVLATCPNFRVGSRSGPDLEPNCCHGYYHTTTWTVAIGPVLPPQPDISKPHVSLQLSIWVLIVSWHDQYVNCAVSRPLPPPAFRFVIWTIFLESRLKTCEFCVKFGVISQWFYEYWLHCKSERGRWKSAYNCTIHILTMSLYDQNSDT